MESLQETVVTVSVVAAITLIALSPAACSVSEHRAIAQLVEGGASPAEARCAVIGKWSEVCMRASVLDEVRDQQQKSAEPNWACRKGD